MPPRAIPAPTLAEPFRLTLEMQHICDQIAGLLPYEETPETRSLGNSYTAVPIPRDALSHLGQLRDRLIRNRVQVSTAPFLAELSNLTIVEMPQLLNKAERVQPKAQFLSSQAHVLRFHGGWCALSDVAPKADDCLLLVPLAVPGSIKTMIWADNTINPGADAELQPDTALLISAKCKLWVGRGDDGGSGPGGDLAPVYLQCAVFCLAGMY